MYSLFFLSYLCFSTASSRKAKEAASWNLQPLQTNLKVLQEQQTQGKHSMLCPSPLVNSPGRSSAASRNIAAGKSRERGSTSKKKSVCGFIAGAEEKPHPRRTSDDGAPSNSKSGAWVTRPDGGQVAKHVRRAWHAPTTEKTAARCVLATRSMGDRREIPRCVSRRSNRGKSRTAQNSARNDIVPTRPRRMADR